MAQLGSSKVFGDLAVTGTVTNGAYTVPRKFAMDVPAGNVAATIPHNLGTTDVIVQLYRLADGVEVESDVTRSLNAVVLGFQFAPTAGQYRCVVLG